MFFPFSWILGMFEWTLFDPNPVDCFFKGVVGACGISVLCSLMRVYYFLQHAVTVRLKLKVSRARVSSLIVLEFSLRAISAWASASMDPNVRGLELLLVQCQFSLGCSLTCTLDFLHQGWVLANFFHSLWSHVARLYPLHSTERYCGKCITLLTSGHAILASLQRVVVLAFAVATVASTATVYDHFLSQKDALKFWTPLTLCYTMLVAYIQEDQHRQTGTEALLHIVVVRLGALLVLMLTVGDWSDVLQILIAFLAEAVCLLPSQDLLQAALKLQPRVNMNGGQNLIQQGN
uniref:Transmembrane protein 82 n=1 Tax=Sphaeramia orbicularis TaxID=375764 RepID=A0A673CBJ2_9TELE